jgi:homospermidine synthase
MFGTTFATYQTSEVNMTNVIIFSVFQSKTDEHSDYKNTGFVQKQFKACNIPFKLVQGVYKGNKELSFIIDLKYQNAAMELARQYNQESVLVVDSIGKATLKYLPMSIESDTSLGYFQETTETIAKSHDAYTYDIDTGIYYICTPDRRGNDRISFDTRTWDIQ